jgi:hypothetical protein
VVKFRKAVIPNHVSHLGDILLPAFGIKPQALGQRQPGHGLASRAQLCTDGAQLHVLGVAVQVVQITSDRVPNRGEGLDFVALTRVAPLGHDAAVGLETVLAEQIIAVAGESR